MRSEWVVKSIDVLIELHSKHCNCSYCTDLHFGFNIPAIESNTSWTVIKIWKIYIRFTKISTPISKITED